MEFVSKEPFDTNQVIFGSGPALVPNWRHNMYIYQILKKFRTDNMPDVVSLGGLTRWCMVTHMYVSELGHDWLLPVERYAITVIMGVMASQITCVPTVCTTVCSGVHQRKHQTSASLAFVRGIHRWIPLTKGQYCRKCFHSMKSSYQCLDQ